MSGNNRDTAVDEQSVEELPGVGPKTAGWLELGGFKTVEDVARSSLDALMENPNVGPETAKKARSAAREMVFGDDGEDGDEDDDDSAGEHGGAVGIYGGRRLHKTISMADSTDDIPDGEPMDDFAEALNSLDEAIRESPFVPSTLVIDEFTGWELVVRAWCAAMRDADNVYEPTARTLETRWPDYGVTHITNRFNETVQIRYEAGDSVAWTGTGWTLDGDGEYVVGEIQPEEAPAQANKIPEPGSLTTDGWATLFRNHEEAIVQHSQHAILVNQDGNEDSFVYMFGTENPRGKIHPLDTMGETKKTAQELLDVTPADRVDAHEQIANVDWKEVIDGNRSVPALGQLSNRTEDELVGPNDDSEDRTELNQTSDGNSSYVVRDNPGGGEGSADYTTR